MSLHLVKIGRDRAIVCSDGLGLSQQGKARTDCEKLFKTGPRSVCGIVGQNEWGPGAEIAACIDGLLRSKPSLIDSPFEFLTALSDVVHPAFARLVAAIPGTFEWLLPDTKMLFGAFSLLRKNGGEITLIELLIPLENVDGRPRVGRPEIIDHLDDELLRGTYIFRLGCDCLEGNRLIPLEPDVADDSAILASVDGMIDSFKRDHEMCAREIGGAVEVVAIDNVGVRWLRKDGAKASLVGRARRRFSSLFSWMGWAWNLARAVRA